MRGGLPVLLIVWLSVGCSTPSAVLNSSDRRPSDPAAWALDAADAREVATLDAPLLPDSLHWSRNSAEHRAAYEQTYRLAAAALARRVEALPAGTHWAVSLDADETVLDNSLYQKSRGFLGFSPESWTGWVRLQCATALPGAREFLERVRASGGVIAIVTDRDEDGDARTRANLDSERLPFDVLLCKPASGDQSKGARWKRLEDGTAAPGVPPLTLVMWLGDNIKDFPAGAQVGQDDAFFSKFGDAYFVLPNPMYGSWTTNPRK